MLGLLCPIIGPHGSASICVAEHEGAGDSGLLSLYIDYNMAPSLVQLGVLCVSMGRTLPVAQQPFTPPDMLWVQGGVSMEWRESLLLRSLMSRRDPCLFWHLQLHS